VTGKLATYVHVADEHEAMHVFGPGDDLPEWAARKIFNPKAWVDGKVPYPYDESRERTEKARRLRAQLAELEALNESSADAAPAKPAEPSGDGPPPKGGPGSGAPAWREYCRKHQVEVADDASREDCIDTLTSAGVPTE
jgi:hypothetical protein